jgi:GDP-L-fucose synthase
MGISKQSRIFLAGHSGFLGTAIHQCLKRKQYDNVITFSRNDLDLIDLGLVFRRISEAAPEVIINAAGRTGGVLYNQQNPLTMSLENLLVQNSIFYAATKIPSVSHIIFLGSSCMYPRNNDGPMDESFLFKGMLEPTSFSYSMAKLSGASVSESINKQSCGCTATTIIPSGVYGPGDDFDPSSSHVVAALINKFATAKNTRAEEVTLFGDGSPVRQFVYVNDVADFIVYCLENSHLVKGIFNVGNKESFSIKELADTVKKELNYKGKINWDSSKPNGAPYKVLDLQKSLEVGWSAPTSFLNGLREAIKFFNSLEKD